MDTDVFWNMDKVKFIATQQGYMIATTLDNLTDRGDCLTRREHTLWQA